jgi:hypothetical protein
MTRRKPAEDRRMQAPIENVKDGFGLPAAGLEVALDEAVPAPYGERAV